MTHFRSDEPISVSITEDGAVAKTAGSLKVELDRIRKISIDNIVRVRRYMLSNDGDFVIHKIEFINDGTAVLGYSKSGKLMQFKTTGILVSIERGDHITLDVVQD